MPEKSVKITVIAEITDSIRKQVTEFIKNIWTSGDPVIVSKGRIHYIEKLPGYFTMIDDKIAGVITYNIENIECEIVSLDSKIENIGTGAALLDRVIEKARGNECRRVWLITTNDNTRAIRFYQKRNFDMTAFYRDEVEKERKIKPGIPLLGNDGIPIKHEIEFELLL